MTQRTGDSNKDENEDIDSSDDESEVYVSCATTLHSLFAIRSAAFPDNLLFQYFATCIVN